MGSQVWLLWWILCACVTQSVPRPEIAHASHWRPQASRRVWGLEGDVGHCDHFSHCGLNHCSRPGGGRVVRNCEAHPRLSETGSGSSRARSHIQRLEPACSRDAGHLLPWLLTLGRRWVPSCSPSGWDSQVSLSTAHGDPQNGRGLPNPATLLEGKLSRDICLPARVLFSVFSLVWTLWLMGVRGALGVRRRKMWREGRGLGEGQGMKEKP